MTQPKLAFVVCALSALALAGGCGKKEEPAANAAAPVTAAPVTAARAAASQPMPAQAAEVRTLVEDTKRYAESLRAQPAGDPASAAQLAKLPGLLEQLLRHMEERAQAAQQGGDVARPEAQVAQDLREIQEVQSALPASSPGQPGTPALAGEEKPSLEQISENLAKITQIAQRGKELVAVFRRPKGASAEGESGTPPSAGMNEAGSQNISTGGEGTTAALAKEPDPVSKEPESTTRAPIAAALKMPESSSATTCCTVVANPTMKGRLGRLVVTYPGGNIKGARIDVSKGDSHATYGHGNQAFELLPGSYTVVISGKRVENVTVQSGHDTNVKVGVLRVSAPGGTRMDVLDKDGKTHVTYGHGNQEFGLPIGAVHLKIAGQMEVVTILEGQITDF